MAAIKNDLKKNNLPLRVKVVTTTYMLPGFNPNGVDPNLGRPSIDSTPNPPIQEMANLEQQYNR